MKYWYRVSITAVRPDLGRRVEEMIADVEAYCTQDAIELARHANRKMIDRCYHPKGRRYTARRLGTTEELVNNA